MNFETVTYYKAVTFRISINYSVNEKHADTKKRQTSIDV